MASITVVRRGLRLLSRRDRRVLVLALCAQILAATLDLIGVLLLGGVAAVMTASLGGGTSTPIPLLSRFGIGAVSSEAAVIVAGIAGVLLVTKTILSWFLTRRILAFLATRQAAIASVSAERVLTQPLGEVQADSSQQTAMALTVGLDAITQQIIAQAMIVLSELALVVILALGLFLVDPLVTVFTVLYFGMLAIVLQRFLGVKAMRMGVERSAADIESIEVVQNALRTYREITVSARRGFFITRFQELRWLVARVMADMFLTSQVGKYVFEIGLVVGAGSLTFILVTTKDLPAAVGVLTITLIAASRVFPGLLRIQSALVAIRNAEGYAEPAFRLIENLDKNETETGAGRKQSLELVSQVPLMHYEGFSGQVKVEGVSLTYPGRTSKALDDVSILCPAGSSTAIVGPSGAGKTSLTDVMLGIQVPQRGDVKISDVHPRDAMSRWPGAMAYVPQDVYLLSGTIRSNVALGLPEGKVVESAIWAALERARLAEFVAADPKGLDAAVGEGGLRLSGGQRQRLGIARALYSDPKLLVLDEATSALDAETEHALSETLKSLEGEVTLVVVAHRLATVQHSDQVAYLADGRILSVGDFSSVRRSVPDFDRQAKLLGL